MTHDETNTGVRKDDCAMFTASQFQLPSHSARQTYPSSCPSFWAAVASTSPLPPPQRRVRDSGMGSTWFEEWFEDLVLGVDGSSNLSLSKLCSCWVCAVFCQWRYPASAFSYHTILSSMMLKCFSYSFSSSTFREVKSCKILYTCSIFWLKVMSCVERAPL